MSHRRDRPQAGLTLVELLVAIAVGALLLAGLGGVAGQAQRAQAEARERNDLARDARLAMRRMVAAVATSEALLVPKPERAATAWSESVREPGVLAVLLDATLDRDRDGFADADNDKDGRVDEDPSGDVSNDLATGIVGIDDDGDGAVDEAHGGAGPAEDDDDEDGTANEDGWDGVDDDDDGLSDEDPEKDMNGDALAGVGGVDDDGDGSIDEGPAEDDDEDGAVNEDWLDTVVYRLLGTDLLERTPDINAVDGNDWSERVVAANVSRFRVERVPAAVQGQPVLVDITLELTGASGRKVKIGTRVRVGGAL